MKHGGRLIYLQRQKSRDCFRSAVAVVVVVVFAFINIVIIILLGPGVA